MADPMSSDYLQSFVKRQMSSQQYSRYQRYLQLEKLAASIYPKAQLTWRMVLDQNHTVYYTEPGKEPIEIPEDPELIDQFPSEALLLRLLLLVK